MASVMDPVLLHTKTVTFMMALGLTTIGKVLALIYTVVKKFSTRVTGRGTINTAKGLWPFQKGSRSQRNGIMTRSKILSVKYMIQRVGFISAQSKTDGGMVLGKCYTPTGIYMMVAGKVTNVRDLALYNLLIKDCSKDTLRGIRRLVMA